MGQKTEMPTIITKTQAYLYENFLLLTSGNIKFVQREQIGGGGGMEDYVSDMGNITTLLALNYHYSEINIDREEY